MSKNPWLLLATTLLLAACLGDSKSGSAGQSTSDTLQVADGFVDDGPAFVPLGDVGPESLVTHPLFVSALCAGGTLRVDYTSTLTVGADNVFSVQVSAPDGSFDGFVNVGSTRSTTSGTIYATLPSTLAAGDGYRVRVVASSPYTPGSDNGDDLGVGAIPAIDDQQLRVSPNYVTVGEQVNWSGPNAAAGAGPRYRWDFGPSATPASASTRMARVTYATGGLKTATYTLTTAEGCSATVTSDAEDPDNGLTVIDCSSVPIPSDVTVVKGPHEATHEDSGAFWVCPGGSLSRGNGGRLREVYVEPGGSVNYVGGGIGHLYARTGSSVAIEDGGLQVVVAAEGASVSDGADAVVVSCPSITFDLSDAPTPGCD